MNAEREFIDPLTLASLFEETFSIDWLMELSEMKASQVLGRLENETRTGVIVSKGQGKYAFQDLAKKKKLLENMTAPEREKYHRRIAVFLQKENAAYTEMACHLINMKNGIEGCRCMFQAAEQHQKRYQYELASKYFLKIIEDLSKNESAEADILFLKAALSVSKNSTALIRPEKIVHILEQALTRARSRKDKNSMALIEMHLAKNQWMRGPSRMSMVHYKRGISLAEQIEDEDLLGSIALFKFWFNFWSGKFGEAVREFRKTLPDVDQYPTGHFPMVTTISYGNCLIQSGQYNQGLGLLNALYDHCQKMGDMQNAAMSKLGLGVGLATVHKTEEALPYLQDALEVAEQLGNNWVKNGGYQYMAYIYYAMGEIRKSEKYLRKWIEFSKEIRLLDTISPTCMEMLWSMKMGQYPSIPGMEFEKHLNILLKSQSSFSKGIALRYKALLSQQQGKASATIKKDLDLSLKYLRASGCISEIALTGIEIGRYYLKRGFSKKAREWITSSNEMVMPFHQSLIPDDLKHLASTIGTEKDLLKKILELSREIVSLREDKEVVNNILATANNIAGAERAAIFILDRKTDPPGLYLRAAKNLTAGDIEEKSFETSMVMIRQTAQKNKGRIYAFQSHPQQEDLSSSHIRSSICLPMVNRGEVIGVLYLDNRLLASVFKEEDLITLSHFAAMAAIALDNAQAYAEVKAMSQRLEEEKKYYEEHQFESAHSEEIIGKSNGIKKVIALVNKVSESDTTVFIQGETGVGKEVIATAIHRHSSRRDKPFIRVNCSALPESLITSELFGHEKGAYTGAINRRMGRFELADSGTLFLDEIGELPLDVQVRLLRILQTKQFERVGGTQTLQSDFRLIIATNRNLAEEVMMNRFRQDLFYRINVFPIEVPPLRSRKEDIPLLAYHFLKMHSDKLKKSVDKITKTVMEQLMSYAWPGNVRELENVIERGVILSNDSFFHMPELHPHKSLYSDSEKALPSLEESERSLILQALEQTKGKINGKGGAADLLQINRTTFYYRMKKLGIKKTFDGGRLFSH